MTLEPVHIKTIFDIVDRIDNYSKPDDREMENKNLWEIFENLKELKYKGKIVVKSIDKLKRGRVNIENMSLINDPFPLTYSCDSGSTTTQSFDNGLYVNFCHCAMVCTPNDLDLHKKRTIIAAAYSSSYSTIIDSDEKWETADEGDLRTKIIRIPSGIVNRRIDRIVHDIALYLAESEHMLWLKDKIDKNSFFIIDGPIYPKHLIYWSIVESGNILLSQDKHTNTILQNYIDIVNHFIDKELPFIGFVKNPEDTNLMQTLRKKGFKDLPWIFDGQFFKKILSLKEDEKSKCYVTYTNWFMQPNRFYEEILESTSPLIKDKLNAKYNKEYYSLTFFMIYIPSKNLLFKIEAPYGITKDENIREKITKKVLYDVSIHEIPYTLKKADDIAKIRLSEKRKIYQRFNFSRIDTNYNSIRWGDNYENR